MIPAAERLAMRRMRATGATYAEMEAAFPGRSRFRIRYHCNDVAIPIGLARQAPQKRGVKRLDATAAIKLREHGVPAKEIADRFGVSQSAVSHSLRRLRECEVRA
jgi:DNA-binding transcriptional ArsR family regulator